MKSEWSNYIPMEGVNRAMSTRINCHHGRDRLAQEKKKICEDRIYPYCTIMDGNA